MLEKGTMTNFILQVDPTHRLDGYGPTTIIGETPHSLLWLHITLSTNQAGARSPVTCTLKKPLMVMRLILLACTALSVFAASGQPQTGTLLWSFTTPYQVTYWSDGLRVLTLKLVRALMGSFLALFWNYIA